MMALVTRTRIASTRALLVGVVVLFALCGCKNRGGSSGSVGGGGKFRDPLVYGPRIPPQNVPVAEHDDAGGRTDPLTSTGRSDRPGTGYSSGPDRFRGTFIPSPDSTPAALASGIKDGEELKIDTVDDRVPLRPAGGSTPDVEADRGFEQTQPADSATTAPLFAELERYGAKRTEWSLTQEEGQFWFRAAVPLKTGPLRQYSGVGDTDHEAVKQVLEQIKIDRADLAGR